MRLVMVWDCEEIIGVIPADSLAEASRIEAKLGIPEDDEFMRVEIMEPDTLQDVLRIIR
jgi:hypothetical protein